jgi:hypothetical protein
MPAASQRKSRTKARRRSAVEANRNRGDHTTGHCCILITNDDEALSYWSRSFEGYLSRCGIHAEIVTARDAVDIKDRLTESATTAPFDLLITDDALGIYSHGRAIVADLRAGDFVRACLGIAAALAVVHPIGEANGAVPTDIGHWLIRVPNYDAIICAIRIASGNRPNRRTKTPIAARPIVAGSGTAVRVTSPVV